MSYGFDEELAKKTREELEARRKREKQEKPSIQGFLLTILFYGGIAFLLVLVLFGLSEFGSPPLDVDTLPPD